MYLLRKCTICPIVTDNGCFHWSGQNIAIPLFSNCSQGMGLNHNVSMSTTSLSYSAPTFSIV